jgi:integrase
MSVRVSESRRKPGAFEVDVRVRLANGKSTRIRQTLAVSRALARRWGEERERDLIRNGPPDSFKEVSTFEAFAPRFLDGHVRANRQKPSSIRTAESILKWHLVPAFGPRRLDGITNEQVQRLKLSLTDRSPKTVNNVLTMLRSVLNRAVEWGIVQRVPCTIKLLPNPKKAMGFHDFAEYRQLLDVARKRGSETYLMVLLGGDAGLRLGEIVALEWKDIQFHSWRMTVQRSDWLGHVTAPKSGRSRCLPLTEALGSALKSARHLRSERVLCLPDGSAITRDRVIKAIRAAQRIAQVTHHGVHVLRHTFCSHLAMRGAPARAIQELAGHADITTTQRYMHLSPAAIDQAIRLLDERPFEDIFEGSAGRQQGSDADGLSK